jgi:putative transposase
MTAAKGVRIKSPLVELLSGKLEVPAESVFENYEHATRWVKDAFQLRVGRYVERNAARANLVERAEDWMWSSVWRRIHGNAEAKSLRFPWPIDSPHDWLARVNQPLTDQELEAIRQCVTRGTPFGTERWRKNTARRLGLGHTLRSRGRLRKPKD